MKRTGWIVALICSACAITAVLIMVSVTMGGVLFLYLSDKATEVGEISISGLSSMDIEPLMMLTIEGSGFDPDGNAISVSFEGTGDMPVTVPASYADQDSVEVVVPPMVIRPGQSWVTTDIKVVQVEDGRVLTSNTIGGLKINPLDDPGTRTRSGFYAMQFISFNSDCLTSMIGNESDPSIISELSSYRSSLSMLRTLIDSVHRGEAGSVNLSTIDGGVVEMDRTTLDGLDVLLHNIVVRSVDELMEGSNRSMLTRADPAVDEEYERRVLSEVEQYRAYAQKQHDIGAMLLEPAAKFCYGLYTTVTGLVGGAALTMGLAAQVALAVGSSWLTQLASGEIPTPSGTMQTALETIADDKMGVPVIGVLKDPLSLLTKFNEGLEEAKKFRPGEPNGGVMVTGGQRTPDDDARTFFKSAPGAPVRTLLLPEDQTNVEIGDLFPKVPPGHVVYTGTFDGGATFPRTSNCPYDGNVVSHFEYSVMISGTLTGNVDEDGRLTGTLQFQGEWSATGIPGCAHIACVPSNGPISMTQSVSGRTSGFSARGSGMVNDVNGSMDPDSVTGYLSFQTTDGSFTVYYTLTPE